MERKPTTLELQLSPDLAEQIDAWRRTQPGAPSRADSARRLIELGLKATGDQPARSHQPKMHPVSPEDEVRSGPEATERPRVQLDD